MTRLLSENCLSWAKLTAQGMSWHASQNSHASGADVALRDIAKELLLLEASQVDKSYSIVDVRMAHRNAYKPWRSSDEEQVMRLLIDGQSIESIAQKMGRNAGGIISRIRKIHERQFGERSEDLYVKDYTPPLSCTYPDDTRLFSSDEPKASNESVTHPIDPNEQMKLERLAAHLGYHLQRTIGVSHEPEGWTAFYDGLSFQPLPRLFPKPMAFGDVCRSMETMIEAFEPKAPDLEEDRKVRDLADKILEDEELSYAFVGHRENGYEIAVLHWSLSLMDERQGLSFDEAIAFLSSFLPAESWPDIDDEPYIGTGRDYGRY